MQRIHERTIQYTSGLRELRCDIGTVESMEKSWNLLKFVICGELGVNHLMNQGLFHVLILRGSVLEVRYDGRWVRSSNNDRSTGMNEV